MYCCIRWSLLESKLSLVVFWTSEASKLIRSALTVHERIPISCKDLFAKQLAGTCLSRPELEGSYTVSVKYNNKKNYVSRPTLSGTPIHLCVINSIAFPLERRMSKLIRQNKTTPLLSRPPPLSHFSVYSGSTFAFVNVFNRPSASTHPMHPLLTPL